ncbi:TetR family transcriptional regulator C-terminal domain-containing protein [Micromonospora sp. NPDC000663]|uniref:TetR family transcriptional regulator C-terminal domain-containing protein n=1 Tax=Micromonospora sp. NPDC000663 TaxID=3364218 RepID=UPI0036ABB13A
MLERLLARQLRQAQQDGDVDPELDADVVAAGLLALTNGLGSRVLGGQRDGAGALTVLNYHLDCLFRPQAPKE